MNELENQVKDVSEQKVKFNAPLWVIIGLLLMTAGVAYRFVF